MKMIKCRSCGKRFEVDTDNPEFSAGLIAAGVAVGAVLGSIVPGIGVERGGLMGAKCVADAMKSGRVCPRCGDFNDFNGS